MKVKNPELLVAIIAIVVMFLWHALYLMGTAFDSDQSVFYYAGWAIAHGATPYSGITLFEPPVGYLVIALTSLVSDTNLLLIRLMQDIVFSLTLVVVYLGLKKLEPVKYSALLATVLFGINPFTVEISYNEPIEMSIFLLFLFAGIWVWYSTKSKYGLISAGVLLGLAVLDWYTGVFVLIGFVSYYLFTQNWKLLKEIMWTGVGIISVSALMIAVITLIWHGFHQFWLQTVIYQSSARSSFVIDERIIYLGNYARIEWFLVISVIIGLLAGIFLLKNTSKLWRLTWIFAIPFILVIFVPKVAAGANQYLGIFEPFMWLLATSGIILLLRDKTKHLHNLKTTVFGIFLIMLILSGIGFAYNNYGSVLTPFVNNPYNQIESKVAQQIDNITTINQKIWTSEGGIAVLADRQIIPPNSTNWPEQAFYTDVLSGAKDGYGYYHQGLNVLNGTNFMQAWEQSNTTVLVFISGSRATASYPDPQIWAETSGWILEHYHLVYTDNYIPSDLGIEYTVWELNA